MLWYQHRASCTFSTGNLNYNCSQSRPSKPLTALSMDYHIFDIESIWGNNPPAAALFVVDRGNDYTWTDSFYNFVAYGYLWHHHRLDVLTVTGFSPDHSAFNFIERAWAFVGCTISGVILPNKSPTSDTCPCCPKHPGTKEERRSALNQIFDEANDLLRRFLDGKPFGGSEISCNSVPALTCDVFHPGIHSWKNFKPQPHTFLDFLMRHCDKQRDFLSFVKCTKLTCSHCRLVPDRATKLLSTIRNAFHGRLPRPRPFVPCTRPACLHQTLVYDYEADRVYCSLAVQAVDDEAFTHYTSFLQLYTVSPPPTNPSTPEPEFCDEHNYFFASNADKLRHWKMHHQGHPTSSFQHQQYSCNYVISPGKQVH